jgi:uncharacterized Zn finger protein
VAIPNSLYLDCPSCGEKTLHEVLKGRLSKGHDVLETTVKCQTCGHIHNTVVREPKTVNVPIIVSEMGQSKRFEFEFGEEEMVALEEELFVGDANVVITAIEKGDKRVSHSPANEISTLWAKRFDKVRVKISVNKNTKTMAAEVFALPEEEFFVGDLMTIGRDEVVIHSIKVDDGMVRTGGVAARDIVRIYAKTARVTKC